MLYQILFTNEKSEPIGLWEICFSYGRQNQIEKRVSFKLMKSPKSVRNAYFIDGDVSLSRATRNRKPFYTVAEGEKIDREKLLDLALQEHTGYLMSHPDMMYPGS